MRTQAHLVVVPSKLAVVGSRVGYVRGAVASPVCVAVTLFVACLGFGYAWLIGAVVATAVVALLGVLASRCHHVRGYLEEQARLHLRTQRHCRRLRQVRQTSSTRLRHYEELRVMVEEIERIDEAEARRFELQDLLDHLARLALNHQCCVNALRLSGADELPAQLPDANPTSRRGDIVQRRIRHRDDCVRQMAQITDEIEGIDQLIRLVVQRTACPVFDVELGRGIDHRLWELDEVDAAMHQLSA
jgi:hypothetical protein